MRIIKDFINKFLKNSSDDQPWLSYYNKDDNSYYQNVKMESESFNKRFKPK